MATSFSPSQCKEAIRQKALSLGFSACGFAVAEAIAPVAADRYSQWLAEGRNGSMDYMNNYLDLRLDPRTLLEGTQTVISLAVNYYPASFQPSDAPQFAYYAYGHDYHDTVRSMLLQLAEFVKAEYGGECRCCVDTAPLRERYWAQQSGIGFIGRNNQLIIPGKGSFFFLGEILSTLPLPADSSSALHCGNCRRCVDACPTGALNADGSGLDARRCISCMTIEHRGELPTEVAQRLGNRVYGCDECQKACPHNRFASPTEVSDFAPSEEFLSLNYENMPEMTEDDYRRIFRRSAVKRAKYAGLMRNINTLKKNRK